MLPAEPHQSLIDGLACLMALGGSQRPIAVGELAERLGLDAIRTRRLLQTLVGVGLATLTRERRYRLGPAAHAVGARCLAGGGALAAILPAIAHLPAALSVEVGALWRDEVSILHRRPAGGVAGAPPPEPVAATRSPLGLALLARLPADAVRSLFTAMDGSLKPVPGFPSYGDLVEALDHARAGGHVRMHVSTHPPACALAMAIGDPPCLALAVCGDLGHPGEAAYAATLAALRDAVARSAAALSITRGDPA